MAGEKTEEGGADQAAQAWELLKPHADEWFDARLDDFIAKNDSPSGTGEGEEKPADGNDDGRGSAGTAGSTGRGGAGGTGKADEGGTAKAAGEGTFDIVGFLFGKPGTAAKK